MFFVEWFFDFVVCMDQEIIGVVDMCGSEFVVYKEVFMGFWIYYCYQGKGLGMLVYYVVVGFCFGELGVQVLSIGWVQGNYVFERVLMKLGYEFYDAGLVVILFCGLEKIELFIWCVCFVWDRYNNAGYIVMVDGIIGVLRELFGVLLSMV